MRVLLFILALLPAPSLAAQATGAASVVVVKVEPPQPDKEGTRHYE